MPVAPTCSDGSWTTVRRFGSRLPDSRSFSAVALAASLTISATNGAALVLAAILRSDFLASTGSLVQT